MISNRVISSIGAVCTLALCSLPTVGCIEASAVKKPMPFETTQLDACLVIVVDMSGSFRDRWTNDAYDLFISLSDQYFDQAIGSDSRLVIAQLSAADRAVIFEGRPSELMKRFAGPEELGEFLMASSDPSGSQVYEATRRAIDYARSIDGVVDETRLMTAILSDMQDSEYDQSQRIAAGRKLLDSLNAYREVGGGLALYYVASDEVPRWRRILDKAGFEPGQFVIENELTENPRLPEFH